MSLPLHRADISFRGQSLALPPATLELGESCGAPQRGRDSLGLPCVVDNCPWCTLCC